MRASCLLLLACAAAALAAAPVAPLEQLKRAGLMPRACDDKAALLCTANFATCAEGNEDNQAGLCGCTHAFATCLYSVGCLTGSYVDDYAAACQQLGCPATDCNVTAVARQLPLASQFNALTSLKAAGVVPRGCDTQAALMCTASFAVCAENAGENKDALCSCTYSFGTCLYSSECLAGSAAANFDALCQQAGCPAASCNVTAIAARVRTARHTMEPLRAVGLMPAACDDYQALLCTADFGLCANDAGDSMTAICSCLHTFGTCLFTAGCLTGSNYDQFVQACQQAECPAADCNVTSVALPRAQPPPLPANPLVHLKSVGLMPAACDDYQALLCTADFGLCANDAGDSMTAICSCLHTFGTCLFTAGCLTGSNYDQFVQACQQAECPAADCNITSLFVPPAPVVPALPQAAPRACDDYQALLCTADFGLCADDSSDSMAAICACLHTFGTCLYTAGCLTGSTMDQFVQACQQAECPAADCNVTALALGAAAGVGAQPSFVAGGDAPAAPPRPVWPHRFSASVRVHSSRTRRADFFRWFYDSGKHRDRLDGMSSYGGEEYFSDRFFLHETETNINLYFGQDDSVLCVRHPLKKGSDLPKPSFKNFTYVGPAIVRDTSCFLWLDVDGDVALQYYENALSREPVKWVAANRRTFEGTTLDFFEWDDGPQDPSLFEIPTDVLASCINGTVTAVHA